MFVTKSSNNHDVSPATELTLLVAVKEIELEVSFRRERTVCFKPSTKNSHKYT